MNAHTERKLMEGPLGPIELALDRPAGAARGLALIAHPHPLFGGTLDNKVVQTLARAFVALDYVAVRPNFRGVGASAGQFDEGVGETDDLLWLLQALTSSVGANHAPSAAHETVLAGFSFGAYVQTRVAEALRAKATPARRLVLVGLAAGRFAPRPVPTDTLLIHGEKDDTVPLAAVLDWARPQDLAVAVVPGADHFFHRRLPLIKHLVQSAWLGQAFHAEDGV